MTQGQIAKAERDLVRLLNALHKDHAEATKLFYVYISMHDTISHSPSLRRKVARDSTFWNTVLVSLETSLFIAINRIFDTKSKNNIFRLLSHALAHPELFTPQALDARKVASVEGDQRPEWLDDYVASAYYPTPLFFNRLIRVYGRCKIAYTGRYAEIRHKIHAHTILTESRDIKDAYKSTNLKEFSHLLWFAGGLHATLNEVLVNGRKVPLFSANSKHALRETLLRTPDRNRGLAQRAAAETIDVLMKFDSAPAPR